MALAACGTTFWPRVLPAACIVSSGSCEGTVYAPGRGAVAAEETGQRAAVSDNILDRTFEAAAPNQKWIADFTYIWTAERWLYVAVVVDLFSRRVVSWAMKA